MDNESQTEFAHSAHSTVKRVAKRGRYDKALVYQLVDDVKLGHMGFVENGRAIVIPMTVWRVDEYLYFHVANKSRLQRHLEAGAEFCLSFAEYQEWVFAKSAYHHSANYRSAVLFCTGERVLDDVEFDRVFASVINQMEPGRWENVRAPNTLERKATALMKLTVLEGSYKSRNGGPNEEPEDMALPVWHGTKPVCPYSAG
ncbi:MAG: pyridoxamine 5'-phosphate oxidase family protein [Hahellaceae bacterium]|nr:pyridoxamine 5'-phosphate oxidase family protein [Anaerolineae bacterium]MCP5162876.1 pyridoxamine 5'-phosphate oxidase family protein [Hahellaceae bacterium]MCP5168929.1 pyridoxamine 5'-phosphate oxidase family protein [Hahellaceae bacterium]